MIPLRPEILKKNGKKEFVVLPYKECVALQELREAKKDAADEPRLSMDELRRKFGLAG